MSYRETSRSAWYSILPVSSEQKRKVIHAVSKFGPLHIEGIALVLGLRVHAVSGRVTDLQNDGLLEDSGERAVTSSGRTAIRWRLTRYAETGEKPQPPAPPTEQLSLWGAA